MATSPTAELLKKPATKATPAKKATAKKTVAKKVEPHVFEEVVSSIENMNQKQAEIKITELMESESYTDFQLGGVLSLVKVNAWWSDGYATFKDYLEEKHGLAYRKATFLIAIYDNLVDAGISQEQVEGLGWSVLKNLAPILTQDNVEEWVERADNLNQIQLIEAVKAYKDLGEEATAEETEEAMTKAAKLTTVQFKCHDDQKEIIKLAVSNAKEDTDTEYDAVALERICLQYIEGGNGKQKVTAKDVESYMKKAGEEAVLSMLEKVFPDMKIQVVL